MRLQSHKRPPPTAMTSKSVILGDASVTRRNTISGWVEEEGVEGGSAEVTRPSREFHWPSRQQLFSLNLPGRKPTAPMGPKTHSG